MKSPDRWQADLLREIVTRREPVILNASRQIGKTETVSLAAYISACDGLTVLVISPSDRQSVLFHRRILKHHRKLRLCEATEDPNKHTLTLQGGGSIEALPNSPDKIRGFDAVDLLIIDEAARVSDILYEACLPFLIVNRGRLALLSTPFGQRGFFWDEWRGAGRKGWRRHKHPWHHCPRFDTREIDKYRHQGEAYVAQEFECVFNGVSCGYFDAERFESLITEETAEEFAW